jgi:hypothetical protein
MINLKHNFVTNYMKFCVIPEINKNRPQWMSRVEIFGDENLIRCQTDEGMEILATPFFEEADGLPICMMMDDQEVDADVFDFEFSGDPLTDAKAWIKIVKEFCEY